MKYDNYSQLGIVQALAPVSISADATGITIDTLGYESCTLIAQCGISVGTDGSNTINFEVEESDDASTWNDVADTDLLYSVTGANAGTFGILDDVAAQVFQTGYRGSKRYVRVVANEVGTVTSAVVSAVAILGRPLQGNVNPVTV